MTMIHITNIEQLEKMISVLGSNSGRLEVYGEQKLKRDDDINTIIAIIKKCRSMVADIENQSESTKEGLGWLQGAISSLEKAKGEF